MAKTPSVASRCARDAWRSLVNTTTPREIAGHKPLPTLVSWVGGVQVESAESCAVKICQRQSADRESYHTARTFPCGSTSSRGRWLIALGSSAILTGADQLCPASLERLALIARFAPELCNFPVSHATTNPPLKSATTLGCRSEALSLALTRTGLCQDPSAGVRTLARISQLSGSVPPHKRPEYLALNPYGRVPAIDDDGFVLFESAAILMYLEATQPSPALVPDDPRGRALVDLHLRLCDAQFAVHAATILFPKRFRP